MNCPTCGGATRPAYVDGSFIGSAMLLYHYARLVADERPVFGANVRLCDTCRLARPIPQGSLPDAAAVR